MYNKPEPIANTTRNKRFSYNFFDRYIFHHFFDGLPQNAKKNKNC